MKFTSSVDKRDLWTVIVLCLVVFAAYISCLPNSFMFDDQHMVARNNYIKQARFIPRFFQGYVSSCPVDRGMYRPFLMLTFSFNYLLGGLKPYGYHLVNIFIHFLNAYILYVLLKHFFRDLRHQVLLGLVLIFAVHPVNTEAVAYISSRSTLLVSLCVLASLYSYILWKEKRGGRYYVFSLLLYSAGLLTKETGLVLPLLIAAYEFVFSDTLSFENCKRVARALIPFAVITVVYCAVIKLIYGDVFGLFGKPKPRGIPPRSFLSNFLTQSAISFFYLHLFFFPFRLCLEHAFPVILRFSDWVGALSVFAVAFAIGGALFLRKRLPLVSFAILWYFIWLVPQFYARLNLPAAEHHAYPAFFAVYIILAFFLSRPLPGCTGQYCCPNGLIGKTGRMCFIFVFGLFSLLTIARCMEWRNEYTFWKSTLRINPHSGIALGSIAVDLINRGHIDEGFRYLEQSVASARLTSTRVTSLLNLIYYNAFLGRTETAERLLAENRQLILKNHPFGYYKNSAFVQEQSGHPQEALEALLAAHRIIPEDESVNGFLGWWYLEHGSDLDKAEVFFRASLRIDPENHLNRLGLAKVLQQKGAYQDAVQEYVRAIEAAPEKYEYYYAAGLIYSMNLHRREAEWYFQKCIALAPTFAPAYYNLCIFYLSLEEPNYFRARQYCDKARELGYTVDEKIENLIQRKAR